MVRIRINKNTIYSIFSQSLFQNNFNSNIFLQRTEHHRRVRLENIVFELLIGEEFDRFEFIDRVFVEIFNRFLRAVPENSICCIRDSFLFDRIRKLSEYFEEKEIVHHA